MPLHGGETTAGGSTAGWPAASSPQAARAAPVPTLTVLGHADLERIGDRALLGPLLSGRTVAVSRVQPELERPAGGAHAPIDDAFVSRRPITLSPRDGGGLTLSRGRCTSRLRVDGRTVGASVEIPAPALDGGVVIELAERIALLLHRRPPPASPASESSEGGGDGDDYGMVGDSAGIEAVRRAIARVAALDVPVLVRGETGTGKELVARALHRHGGRRDGPFVAVNLGALPPALAAAELFGARRGAYTGAERDRAGLFVRANGGTLFLDEVGEAPAEVQVMLLRALEGREVVPVGGGRKRRVDVRIVAATDADLGARIADSGFRAALLHRLAGYAIQLPPLRARRDDIGRLLVHFLRREMRALGAPWPPSPPRARRPWLPAALAARLARAPWPGNVRQLENVARQLAIDGRDRPALDPEMTLELAETETETETKAAGRSSAAAIPRVASPPPRVRRRPSEIGEDELVDALRRQRWNVKAAAEALGVPRTSLYALVERSPRVRVAADVPPAEVREAFARCGGDVRAMVDVLEVSERALRQRLKDLGLR